MLSGWGAIVWSVLSARAVEFSAWWLVLFVQGASFTWVSRARNSGSVAYASLAGLFSHGLWFASQVFLIVKIVEFARAAGPVAIVAFGVFYVSAVLSGQSAMMIVAMRWLEKGHRAVGARGTAVGDEIDPAEWDRLLRHLRGFPSDESMETDDVPLLGPD